jgi:hypothetical protein
VAGGGATGAGESYRYTQGAPAEARWHMGCRGRRRQMHCPPCGIAVSAKVHQTSTGAVVVLDICSFDTGDLWIELATIGFVLHCSLSIFSAYYFPVYAAYAHRALLPLHLHTERRLLSCPYTLSATSGVPLPLALGTSIRAKLKYSEAPFLKMRPDIAMRSRGERASCVSRPVAPPGTATIL